MLTADESGSFRPKQGRIKGQGTFNCRALLRNSWCHCL